MQPENQVLLPKAVQSMTTQSPSVSYPTAHKDNKEDEAKKKAKEKMRKWRILINSLMFILILINFCLMSFLVITVARIQLKPKVEWANGHEPQSFALKHPDFLISSTSETCNEFVREYLMVDVADIETLDIAYIFMMFCLDNAEPHRSSQAGNNVLLKADAINEMCYTINGFGVERELTAFIPFIEVHKEAEYSGSKAIHDPAAFRVVEDFVQKRGNRGKKIVLHFLMELSKIRFPVTKQLYSVISQSNIENTLLFQSSDSFSFLFRKSYDKSLAMEGELMQPRKRSWVLDRNTEMVMDRVKKYGNSAFKDDKMRLRKKFAFNKEATETMESKKMVRIPGTNYGICSMKEPYGMEKKTVASLLLEYATDHDKNIGVDAVSDVKTYKKIFGLLLKHFPETENILKKIVSDPSNLTTQYDQQVAHLSAMGSRGSNLMNYEANSFVIVDKTKQTAVAYSSSLGTAFGSFISLFSTADIGNNMMYGFGQKYKNVAEYQYLMDPIIITKDKEIFIGYAGQGGFFDTSRDIARRFHSLIFTLFHNVSLSEALRTPLVFPLDAAILRNLKGNGNEPCQAGYLEGFPWVHVNGMRDDFPADFKPQQVSVDIVTAVHDNTAVHFDGNDVSQLYPHGL